MKVLLWLAVIVSLASCTTTYYVVRHADRLDNSYNSPLSGPGQTRAVALRDTLLSKGIDSIFISTFLRTEQTAQPLATATGITMVRYLPDTTDGLIRRLKKINGKDVLIVGHSDKVPLIVQGLSGQQVPAIADDDFDNLYIIRVRKCLNVRRSLVHTTYGAPSP